MNRLVSYLFFGFSFFLSIKTTISNFFLILILISLIAQFFIQKRKIFFKEIIFSLLPIFIFSLISLFWSSNVTDGLLLLKRQSVFVLVPLCFVLIPKEDIKEYLKYSFYGLLTGSVIISTFLLIHTGIKITNLKYLTIHRIFSSKLTNHGYLSRLINIHPSYFGMYNVFSIAIVLFYKIKIKKIIKFIIIIILMLNLLFLNSRVQFFLLFIILLLKIILIKSKKIKLFYFFLLVIFSSFGIYILRNTYIVKKIAVGTLWEISENRGTYNTTKKFKSDSRMARWKAILKEVPKNIILGNGIGSEKKIVLTVYKKRNLNVAYKKSFNTHNQFLYYLVITGSIGFFLFLILFIQGFILAYKNKDLLMLYFYFVLFFLSLFENILYRNAGIVFVAIYVSLFNKQYLKT